VVWGWLLFYNISIFYEDLTMHYTLHKTAGDQHRDDRRSSNYCRYMNRTENDGRRPSNKGCLVFIIGIFDNILLSLVPGEE